MRTIEGKIRDYHREIAEERDRLRALNAELLAAAEAALPVLLDDMKNGYGRKDGADHVAVSLIRTVLAKARGGGMTLDIVKRLRSAEYECSMEAADEIERLRALNAELLSALAEMIKISKRNSEPSLMLLAIRMCAAHALAKTKG